MPRRSKSSGSPLATVTKLRNGSYRIPCILSYPFLHTPQKSKDGDQAKYTMAAIISKKVDLEMLEDAIEDAADAKWGDDRPKRLSLPIRDGEEYEDKEGYDDTVVFFNCRNTRKPYVRDLDGYDITDPEEAYPGCRGLVIVEPYGYDRDGNRGVALSLQGFIKVAEGDRLGGKAPNDPDEDMEDLSGDLDPEEFAF